MNNRLFGFIILSALVLSGCSFSSIRGNSYYDKAHGFSFEFPEGWSPMSGSEIMERFDQPKDRLLVCLGDPDRNALMHVAVLNMNMAEEAEAIESAVKYFNTHFSGRIDGYRSLKLDRMDLNGKEAVELIFKKPGRTYKEVWVKQIYFVSRGNFLCLTFGIPSAEEERGRRALLTIVENWEWL